VNVSKSNIVFNKPVLVREKLLVLATINTMQPISIDELQDTLSSQLPTEKFNKVMTVLRKEGLLISLKDGKFLVSRKGRDTFGSKSLGKARDISRMLYLIARSKGGGGAIIIAGRCFVALLTR